MEPNVQQPSGTTGGQPVASDPQEREPRRRAVAAAYVQLASPFLFVGMLFLGLAVDIPIAGDPHGYGQIFAFFASFLLLIPGTVLPSIAIALLRRSRRSGAVWLIVAAGLSCLMFLGLVSGAPGGIGELDWSRLLTIAVGVVWLVVSIWCLLAGTTAYSRLSPGRPHPVIG
ncbi:hypothetical protein [Pseudactinotalea suaedae]|uniref:hypothetical protein n=1 Tax=Pseudactinotalea suaedae TaxID=1524924 RepID=UPI0012E29E83|nr:hypothetical protein [Pseudactinotalea suaedae]